MIPLCVQYGKTSLGMFRLWIRVALNDAALGQYLNALIWNKALVTKYYTPQSLLFSEQIHLMLPVLETLTTIHFKLAMIVPGLESADYWQKVTWEPVVKVCVLSRLLIDSYNPKTILTSPHTLDFTQRGCQQRGRRSGG